MRSRKLLAFILCLITGPALAGYMSLLGAGLGTIQPVAQSSFTNSSYSTNLSNLTSVATFSRAGNAMQFDSQGYLTYGPNNLLLNTATLGTQTVTVVSGVNYILSIKGTGSVTLTGASTAGPLNGTGASNRVDLKITAATTSLTLTVSGSVTSARLSAVTYETAFRLCDDVDNTAAAYYGPRFDYTYNGSSWVPAGLLVEGAATNLYLNSAAPAGQTVTVANATQYTISFYGTGSIAVTGAATQTISGTGANVLTSYTFTSASTSLVMGAPTGSVTEPQVETGSFGSSRIRTGASAVTRAAETVQLTGTALAAVQGVQGAVVYEGNGSRGTSVMVGSGGSQYRPYISGTSFSAYDGTTVLSAAGSVPASSVWRGGVTWSAAGRSITLNGGAVASDANGTGTFTNAYLGNNNGSLWVNTHVRSVGFYNQKIPDATLQAKSVVGASY